MLFQKADEQNKNALQNVDGAIKYVIEGESRHPNRWDICKAKENHMPQTTTGTSSQIGFDQQSTGGSSLGKPNDSTNFRSPSQTTFGKPSTTPSAAFGQPGGVTFGQPSHSQPAVFGQPAGMSGQSNFQSEQPSTSRSPFSATTETPNPFPRTTNPFDHSQSRKEVSGAPRNSPFGMSSAPSTSSPFAPQSAVQSGFASQKMDGPNPFSPNTQSVFNPKMGENAFKQDSARQQGQAYTAAGGNGRQSANASIQKDNSGKLQVWNGNGVSYLNGEPCYRGNDGNWRRIWFPDGAPKFVNSEGLKDDFYDDATKESYEHLANVGMFKEGVVPLIPPKREWCDWNL